MLFLSLQLHLFCWEHIESRSLIFSLFRIPHPLLGTQYHRIIALPGTCQIIGPVLWSQRQKDEAQAQKRKENLSRVTQPISDTAGPELWSPQHSEIHSPSIYWVLLCAGHCIIFGDDNDNYKDFFSYRSLRSKWIGQTQKTVVTMTTYLSIITEVESLINLCWFNLRNLVIEI